MKSNPFRIVLAAAAAVLCLTPLTSDAQNVGDMYRAARTAFSNGDLETADTLLDQIVAAQPSYVPARALQAQVKKQLAEKGGGLSMEKQCAAVTIPKIDFHDVELKLALEALAVATSEATGTKFRPNFILSGGDEVASRKVTIQLRNAPLTTILDYLGKMTNVKFRYERFAVIGAPQLTTEPATVPTPEPDSFAAPEVPVDPFRRR